LFRVARRVRRHPETQQDGLPRAAAEVEGLGLAERLVAKGVADFKGLAIQLEGLSSRWDNFVRMLWYS